jgi:competence protein ComEC
MLRIHFLNVGHGDCTIIEHPSGRLTMIDVNNSQEYDSDTFGDVLAEQREKERARGLGWALSVLGGDPLTGFSGLGRLGAATSPTAGLGGLFAATATPGVGSGILSDPPPNFLSEFTQAMETVKGEVTDPVAFMQKHYSGRRLWRFILTHPDLDHMRGIKRLYETVGFDVFWDTAHTKPTPAFRGDADKEDWTFYQRLRSGLGGVTVRRYLRGNQLYAFARNADGSLGGDGIEILSPTPALIASCNAAGKSNDLSYVLRVWHQGRSVLLPGDIEEEAWNDLGWAYGAALKSDFMRSSHHGRDTGYHLPTLKIIRPSAAVVSVGRKPVTDASNKYCAQCPNVYSTRYYGNLELRVHDDGTYQWLAERNA